MSTLQSLLIITGHKALGAEWAWEPKTVPRWGSPNTLFVQIRVAVRGELCYLFVCVSSASGL